MPPYSRYGDLAGFTRVASHIGWINNVLAGRIRPSALGFSASTASDGFLPFSDSETVPEPSAVLGLLAIGILGAASSRSHTRKSK